MSSSSTTTLGSSLFQKDADNTSQAKPLPELPCIPVPITEAEKKPYSSLLTNHDQLLTQEYSKLFQFYLDEIVGSFKSITDVRDQRKNQECLDKKECRKLCNKTDFSYQDSVIWRHTKDPAAVELAKKMIELDYRYCADCHRIIPKPERKKGHKDTAPLICPCCGKRLAYLSVLIRKTKMKEALFKHDGY